MRIVLLFTVLLYTSTAFGLETVNQTLLNHAKACPKTLTFHISSLVNYLKKATTREDELVEVLCYWIAENIAYDTRGYTTGQFVKTDKTLLTRKGICQNYAELLQRMCQYAGIECHIVTGYSKGYGYIKNQPLLETDHAWNVIKVNGNYVFVDATWASGYVEVRRGVLTFVKKLNLEEIMAEPNYFAIKHLPGDPRWQLRPHPITLKGFANADSLIVMLQEVQPFYNYADSINSYLQSDSIHRGFLSAESTYRFNPTKPNLSELADACYTKAWHYGNDHNDRSHYEQSIAWYERSIRYYKMLNTPAGQQWIANAQKGITYSKHKLQQLDKPN